MSPKYQSDPYIKVSILYHKDRHCWMSILEFPPICYFFIRMSDYVSFLAHQQKTWKVQQVEHTCVIIKRDSFLTLNPLIVYSVFLQQSENWIWVSTWIKIVHSKTSIQGFIGDWKALVCDFVVVGLPQLQNGSWHHEEQEGDHESPNNSGGNDFPFQVGHEHYQKQHHIHNGGNRLLSIRGVNDRHCFCHCKMPEHNGEEILQFCHSYSNCFRGLRVTGLWLFVGFFVSTLSFLSPFESYIRGIFLTSSKIRTPDRNRFLIVTDTVCVLVARFALGLNFIRSTCMRVCVLELLEAVSSFSEVPLAQILKYT